MLRNTSLIRFHTPKPLTAVSLVFLFLFAGTGAVQAESSHAAELAIPCDVAEVGWKLECVMAGTDGAVYTGASALIHNGSGNTCRDPRVRFEIWVNDSLVANSDENHTSIPANESLWFNADWNGGVYAQGRIFELRVSLNGEPAEYVYGDSNAFCERP